MILQILSHIISAIIGTAIGCGLVILLIKWQMGRGKW